MTSKNLPRIDADKYRGQWLALDPATYEVPASASTLKETKAAAAKRGWFKPLLYPVPKSDGYFVGVSRLP